MRVGRVHGSKSERQDDGEARTFANFRLDSKLSSESSIKITNAQMSRPQRTIKWLGTHRTILATTAKPSPTAPCVSSPPTSFKSLDDVTCSNSRKIDSSLASEIPDPVSVLQDEMGDYAQQN